MGAVRDKDRRDVSLGTGGGHQAEPWAHLNDRTSPWPGHSEAGRQETRPE